MPSGTSVFRSAESVWGGSTVGVVVILWTDQGFISVFVQTACSRVSMHGVCCRPAGRVTRLSAYSGRMRGFWDALTRQGLGGTRKNLFIRNAQLLSSEVWKKLSAVLGVPRPGILPVFFLESVWEKGQPKLPPHLTKLRCLEFAEKKRWIWRAPALDARGIRRFIQERASALGLTIRPDAMEVLGESLPPDAASEHTRNIARYTPDLVLFDLIRHVQEGRADKAWHAVLREGDSGDGILFPLLGLMAREGRMLWQLQAGESVYVPQHVAGMKRQLAARLGSAGLARIFAALCEAEWSVKSGRLQPGQSLERLIAELTLLFASTPKCDMAG